MSSEYSAESIKVLEGLEAVRVRPGMYIGGVSGSNPNGLFRICKEIIDNSLDEYLAGKNKTVVVMYNSKSKEVAIIDHGRGIPTGKKKNGDYALTDAMTKLHAGGKFEEGAYKVSSGLHGVGAKAANAVSEHFQVWSNSGSGWYTQSFKRGKPVSKVEKGEPKEFRDYLGKTGVVVKYKPDEKIFIDTVSLNVHRVKNELSDIQYLCPNLKILFIIDGIETKYYSEQGLKDMVYREGIVGKPFLYKSENLEVALNWIRNESITGCSINSYVNISFTSEGGTHLDGLRRVVLKVLRGKTEEKVEADDLMEGLVGAIHWKMVNPVYAGQTKDKLTNAEVTKEVINQLEEPLRNFFEKNKNLSDSIIKYAEKMLKERAKLKDSSAILKGIDKLAKNIRNIPDKFTDADRRQHRHPSDIELFIVEGDSAGGHFKQARESFQAMLQIRGKIINAARATPSELFGGVKGKNGKGKKVEGNKEIRDLITVLGCGIEPKVDLTRLRFGKVIILSDSDTDGSHIKNLVLSFFVKYIPSLIKDGYVFLIDAPLFVGSCVGDKVFGKTRNEIDMQMKKKGIKKYVISRLKGWGECEKTDSTFITTNKGLVCLKDLVKDHPYGWSKYEGDLKVIDRCGNYKHIKNIFRKKSKTLTIHTAAGNAYPTKKHKFLTLRGTSLTYVEAGELRERDVLAMCRKEINFSSEVNNDVAFGFKKAVMDKLNSIVENSQGALKTESGVVHIPINGTLAKDFTMNYLKNSDYIEKLSKVLPEEAKTLQEIVDQNMYFVKIDSIVSHDEEVEVADLEVEGSHNYVANSFYTHNCSPEELSELCLSPKSRKLIQLEWSDDAEKTIDRVMGDDVSFRKEMLGVR